LNSYSNTLQEGQRLWYDGRPATLVSKDYIYDDSFRYSSRIEYTYTVRFDDDKGEAVTLSDSHGYALYEAIIYYEYSGFSIGDTLEIQRSGLEPNLRGRLLEVDENAERWPYRVGEVGSNSVWFSYAELTKIHSVTSRERAPRAQEVLTKRIAEVREELEALETALEVLGYATT
jgi:hypothetical protein